MKAKRLGDVACFIRGVTFKPDDVVPMGTPGSIACFRTKNVQKDIDLTDVWAISQGFVKVRNKFLRPGDLLVSTANSWNLVGKCSWVPVLPYDATLGGFISALRGNPSIIDQRYLYHWFGSDRIQASVRNCARQTTNIANLSLDQCLAINIPVPPLVEQRRIATILDQADELIRKRKLALDRLRELPSAVFVGLFSSGGEFEAVTRREPLGAHLSFITSGGRGWAEYYSDKGKRFLRSFDVQMNAIGNEDIVYVTPPNNAEARRTEVLTGDVLLTITGSRIGRVAAVPQEFAGSYISQHVAILRLRPSLIPKFLSFYMSSIDGGQRQIAKVQYGQTKPGLNFEQIKQFIVPIPEIDVQREFVQTVEKIDALTTSHRAHLSELGSLFASLQHRAFSGELTAQQAERELELAG